jgi:hypothetical protein
MSDPIFPGGRGKFTGPDALITQTESYDFRARLFALERRVAVVLDGPVWIRLTAAERMFYFDATGRGLVDKKYALFAICNGSNGTIDLNDKFVRGDTTASGATGGAATVAHTHAINHNHGAFTSGAGSAHNHSTSGSTATEASHTHAAGSLMAQINNITGSELNARFKDATTWTENYYASVATWSSRTTRSTTGGVVISESTAAGSAHSHDVGTLATGNESSHTHSIDPPAFTGTSGAASDTNNLPPYYELVPIIYVGPN